MSIVLIALLLAWGSALPAAAVVETSSQSQAADEVAAKLTEAKGIVLKSDHAFDEATIASPPPQPAHKGDLLRDNMQIATGDKSYAQLKWPDVSARAWANSIYALAPTHRLVYLQRGQMIFCLNKNRKDKRDYVLWTNLLQARVHGTTVFVQTDGQRSQISVLEGWIDVLNKNDHSVVRLTPGVVYEVMSKTEPDRNDESASIAESLTQQSMDRSAATSALTPTGISQEPSAEPKSSLAIANSAGTAFSLSATTHAVAAKVDLLPVTLGAPIPLFQTEHTVVSLFAADVMSLLNLPLLTQFESQLESLPLISHALSKLPLNLGAVGSSQSDVQQVALNSVAKSAQIIKVPMGVNYAIGSSVGSTIKLPPDAVSFFPPSAIIGNNSSGSANKVTTLGSSGTQASNATESVINNSTANVTALVTQVTQSSAAAQSRAVAGGIVVVPTGVITTNLGTVVPVLPVGTTILPGGTAILPNGTTITGITGVTSGLTGITGTVTNTLNGVTGTVNNTLSNTLNTLGGVLSGGGLHL